MRGAGLLMLLAVALTTAGVRRAGAQPAAPGAPTPGRPATTQEISINFDNADIREVINTMSRLTGENFLIDPAVKGTVTIVAPRRVPKDQVFNVLQAILELHGFGLVPGENVYKVVQARAATQKDIPVCVGRQPCAEYENDQLVTQLIPLRFANAQELQGTLNPLMSRDANPVVYKNTNTLILTDTAANIRRILGIVQKIDIAGFEQNITILPLQYSNADQLANTVREALEPVGGEATVARRPRRAGQPTEAGLEGQAGEIRIIPEARTNSLIVVANEIDTQQVMFLVRQLDTQTPVEQNNIHVHHLSNALATEIADVLTSLAGAQPAAAEGAQQATRPRTFYREVSVVADDATNSLLLIATPQDYAVLQGVIDRLDIRRPQVLVEVLIAEVSLDFAKNLGIRWAAASGNGNDGAFFGVNEQAGSGSTLGNLIGGGMPVDFTNPDLGTIAGSIPGALPPGGTVGGLAFDMGVLRLFIEANASQSDGDFNLLSTPNLLMLDNEEARIVVADNVPFVTGTLTDTGGTGLAQNETFEFRDVGITLEVTPHIAPDRTVRLELHQEVNEVGPAVQVGNTSTFTEIKREVTTIVLVNDRHTIVLGGLITESDRDTVNKVPVLGNVPVLGWLFKSKEHTISKTDLMLFITPTIVSDLTDSEFITQVKHDELPGDITERMSGAGAYQRSQTFRRPPTELPLSDTAAGAAAGARRPELLDAPVK